MSLLGDPITTVTVNMPSVALQLLEYCEEKGLGKKGVSLFAHDWPDEEKTKHPYSILFIDTSPGALHGVISGAVTCQTEYFVVQCRAKNEKESRELLFPFTQVLHDVKKQEIKGVYYMNTQLMTPIHLVGTDKNNRFIQEIIFTVMRRPA